MAIINGKAYDWNSVTITLPHGIAIDIREISYDDELDKGLLYGKGPKATRYGTGNYKAEGKMTLSKEEYDLFLNNIKSKGYKLYKFPPFPITVSYADDGKKTTTDMLKDCSITKVSEKATQGSKELTKEISFLIIGGVVRDGLEPI